mmetsp:Transcript_45935/g.38676  ORF Transcript_45935/g.38676 Transcript_45935/m.38676 type:complete len:256 (+) Transcript_45935:84-851(+)
MKKTGAARRGVEEISQTLLPVDAAVRLKGENLRVLAEDLEQCLQDVTDTLSGRRSAGWVQRYQRAVQMTQELLQELRTQARRATRQDQVACESIIRSYQKMMTEASVTFDAAQAGGSASADEERKAAATDLLNRVGHMQTDTQASVARSMRIVNDSQRVGQDTAVLVKTQTEQLKDIHADAQSLQAEISRANSLLVKMGRRAMTDRMTSALLILVGIGILGCIAVKIVLGPAPLQPFYPPSPPPQPLPSPSPPLR